MNITISKKLIPLSIALFAILLLSVNFSCSFTKKKEAETRATAIINENRIVPTDNENGKLFEILTGKSTGINFVNTLPDNYEHNYWRYTFIYNGGSVNIGDFNNDGLPDVFFTGVMVPHRIYINKGNLQFEDISATAGITKNDYEWTSGSTVADVNGDGFLDIYICNSRWADPAKRGNKLFINNGDLTFTEKAKEYGLTGDVTCSAANFFDYDNDGDLDMYLVTHPLDFINKFKIYYFQTIENNKNLSDKLYRNNGDGTFTDVHLEAGINNHGFGLSATVADFDENGYLDIYVANDFGMYDFLYFNNGDGTFSDASLSAIKRHSVSSMGSDAADFNNDGLLDLYYVDIEMEENYSFKTFQISSQVEILRTLINAGYGYQNRGNSLKINNGNKTFSEIGRTANVGVTDWGWSTFFTDFDNDGNKDLFVSTGYLQDFNIDETETYSKLRRACRINDSTIYSKFINSIPRYTLNTPNFIFKNNGDLTFKDMRDEWGIYHPSSSYGAASADLDLDGDIDIICANANETPYVYKNNSEKNPEANNYIRFKLKGYGANTYGLGTKIKIYYNDTMQYIQHTNVRGFISTTENIIHFGTGKNKTIETVEITWQDGKKQELKSISCNQIVMLDHANASADIVFANHKKRSPIFTDEQVSSGINYIHKENDFEDFTREFLIPHKMSVSGPSTASGDLDGNGLDDIYIGGTFEKEGEIYLQITPGKFMSSNIKLQADINYEDAAALIFDADNDGDNDLYIGSGGNEKMAGDKCYNDRFYINAGNGNFVLLNENIPQIAVPTSCVIACDFDKDGDLDLLIGGRQFPGKYLLPVSSALLQNDGGIFTDVTESIAPALKNIGMVSSALWSDFDNDDNIDLLITGDWMPIVFLKNNGSAFENITAQTNLENMEGWWQSINGADFDNDGDTDYILGNFGTNRRFKNTVSETTGKTLPLEGYYFSKQETEFQGLLMSYYQHDISYPVHFRERMLEQYPEIRSAIPDWNSFGKMSTEEMFGKNNLANAYHTVAYQFESAVLINNGNNNFTKINLPVEAQVSPVFGIICNDFTGDGITDILCQGNYYQTEILVMRHDAGTGLLLEGKGDGTFIPIRSLESGFWSDGDARSLTLVNCGENKSPFIIAGVNSSQTIVFSYPSDQILNVKANDIYALITYSNSTTQKVEFYNGEGYYSQRSNFITINKNVRSVIIVDYKGNKREALNKSIS
ncbi:MAG: VCBS repeat-containing protein [Chitinophagales bacterium]